MGNSKVTAVGAAIEEYNLLDSEELQSGVPNLIIQVDGAHILDFGQKPLFFHKIESFIKN